jgi:hypothetical protein
MQIFYTKLLFLDKYSTQSSDVIPFYTDDTPKDISFAASLMETLLHQKNILRKNDE